MIRDPFIITATVIITIMIAIPTIILKPTYDCSRGSTSCGNQRIWVPFWSKQQ